MAVELGVGYVSVIPSSRDFGAELHKQLGSLTAKVGVIVDNTAVSNLRKQLQGFSTNVGVNIDGSAANSKLKSQLGNQSALGHQMGTSAGESMASSLTSSVTKAMATVAATIGVSKAVKEGFTAAVDFEVQEVAFTGLLGSASAAESKLKELQEFAKVTPFDFPTMSEAARKLLAFGFTAESIIPTMQTLGDAAGALGASPRDVNLVVRALGQISSKGRVQLEELIQIAENFPGANPIPELAASVNASVPEFIDALAQPGGALKEFGLTGDQAVQTILTSFTKIRGAEGAMARQSLTLHGALTTLWDQLRITAIESGKPFLPGISKAIRLSIVPAIENFGDKVKIFASELDGVGKPVEDRFAIMGDAVGRFAKRSSKAFKDFRSDFVDIGKAFAKAFETGDTTTAEGMIGLAERVGEAFRDLVDGAKAFGKAFATGASDAEKSGFLGFMSDLGDYSRDLVEWLKVKIPKAIDTLNESIDTIKPKIDDFFQFFRDHKDAILTVTAGLAGFVASIKGMLELKAAASIISGIVTPILALGPVGLIAAGVAVLAGAFTVAYTQYPPFKDAIDGILNAFKDGGFAAGIKTIGDELGNLFGKADELWEKAKPVLAEFFRKAKKYIEDGLADLLGFEVVGGLDVEPLPISAATPDILPPAGFDLPLNEVPIEPPPKKKFKSFGEGFAKQMMDEVIPAIGDWFLDNKQKVYDAFEKFLKVIKDWVDEKAIPWVKKEGPRIAWNLLKSFAEFTAKGLLQDAKLALKFNFYLSASAADSLHSLGTTIMNGLAAGIGGAVALPEAIFDQLDKFFSQGGGLQKLTGLATKIAGQILSFPEAAADVIDKWWSDARSKLSEWLTSEKFQGTAWNVVKSILSFPENVADIIDEWWQSARDKLKEWITSERFQSIVWSVVTSILTFPENVADVIDKWWETARDKLKEWLTPANLASVTWSLIKGILSVPENIFDLIDTWWKALFDQIDKWFDTQSGGLWSGFVNSFKGAINTIIGVWNALDFSITAPKWLGGGTVTLGGPDIDPIPINNATGNVFGRETTGLFRFAETARARPEIISPVSLMAETFRNELNAAPGSGRGFNVENINVTEAQSAAAVVDEIHSRLGWMLTTRAER